MAQYTYLTTDGIVSTQPCKVLSVLISQESSGTGEVRLFDARTPETDRRIGVLHQDGDGSFQAHWDGLETRWGLYIEIYSRVDHVTVEWESIG